MDGRCFDTRYEKTIPLHHGNIAHSVFGNCLYPATATPVESERLTESPCKTLLADY
jgi:hypothetical protein